MKKLLRASLLCTAALQCAACGTLLFPERRDARHSGRIDPNVLILDGIGLLFYIVPGLVAFVVDFATESIYLPEDVEEGEGPFIRG